MAAVIEIAGLTKRYRRLRHPPTVAVAGLDLEVPEGGVFGFLGPNGSGKTTTIRCLLGLAAASGGELRLLGRPVPAGLHESLRSVGSVVESAVLLPGMTGIEQIRMLAKLDGIPLRRADEAVESVALGDRAATKVGGYSLGMRQRLALAAALLKDPALLVLDEPANGLDPAGMRDVRELLRRLGREGRTVFLSSHLLAEVEQTCDRVAIIDRGRAVLTSSVSDLLARPGGSGWIVDVAPGEVDRAVVALERRGLNATLVPGSAASAASVRITTGDVDGAAITEALAGAGVWLRGLRREDVHLEDLFLSLTGAAA